MYQKGNQTPVPALQHDGFTVTLEAFKAKLSEMGACPIHIAQGNYVGAFHELLSEPYLYVLYMHHRRRLLHSDALEQARMEYRAAQSHPFAM